MEIEYMQVHAWMISSLGLRGNELLVFAAIYTANLEGIAITGREIRDYCGIISPVTVGNLTKALRKKKLIAGTQYMNEVGRPIYWEVRFRNIKNYLENGAPWMEDSSSDEHKSGR